MLEFYKLPSSSTFRLFSQEDFLFPIFISSIADDDQRSFMEQLYLDYRASMYYAAMGVLRNPVDAEDAVQNVFLSLCGKIPQLMEMSCYVLRSYVVISTRNAAVDVIRKRERKPELLWGEEDYLDSLLDEQSEEETALFALIEQDVLNKAMMQLSLRDRTLLEMKYVLLKPDSQIGEELGIKANSVRPLLGRVKARLQKILKEDDHENAKN